MNQIKFAKFCVGNLYMTIKMTDVEDGEMWRGNIKKIFIDIMVNEVNKGNIDSGIFSTNT